jgi:hypothetical protein
MVCSGVEQAIENLKILQVQREELDYEVVPGIGQIPGGMVTIFMVFLLGPAQQVGDHHSFCEQIDDPYVPQSDYDRLIAKLFDQLTEAQNEEKRLNAPGLSKEKRSSGGLYLPG